MSNDLNLIEPGVGAASYWHPRHFILSAWTEHAPFAAWILSVTRPSLLVELGSHTGFSLFTFAETAQRLEHAGKIVGVDSWEGDDHAGFYGDDVFKEVARIAGDDYPDSIELVRSYFADAVSQFEDGSIDLLHIDGRHGYEDVKEDYELFAPKLSERAVVLFHDTHEFQEGFGVHRFWDEIATTVPSFQFHHGHGLGVLAVGSKVPTAVLDFIAAATADSAKMRSRYAALGERMQEEYALRQTVINFTAEIYALNAQIDTIHRSKSWRITAPARALTSAVSRRG